MMQMSIFKLNCLSMGDYLSPTLSRSLGLSSQIHSFLCQQAMPFHTVSSCQSPVARARQAFSFLLRSLRRCSALSGWGTLGALGSFCWFTCVKSPVLPQGFDVHFSGVLLVAGISDPLPDQNHPLINLG